MAETAAQKRAREKYESTHVKGVYLKFNVGTDRDILARLEQVPNVQGYIKKLIRDDIAGSAR